VILKAVKESKENKGRRYPWSCSLVLRNLNKTRFKILLSQDRYIDLLLTTLTLTGHVHSIWRPNISPRRPDSCRGKLIGVIRFQIIRRRQRDQLHTSKIIFSRTTEVEDDFSILLTRWREFVYQISQTEHANIRVESILNTCILRYLTACV